MSGQEVAFFEVAGRMLLAVLLGGTIGFQREMKDRPAGLRTHALVALGAALYTAISLYGFPEGSADVSRVAANVAVGIGFIGAGTIIRQGNIVMGLTTAASLWTVAAIGMASAAGYGLMAIVVSVLVLLVLSILKKVELSIGKRLMCTVELSARERVDIKNVIKEYGEIDLIEETYEGGLFLYKFTFSISPKTTLERIHEYFSKEGEVTRIRWER